MKRRKKQHIPNVVSRDIRETHNLKLQGGKYHGMYIEMKYGDNKPTENQNRWLNSLCLNGHNTAVCYSLEQAQQELLKYLKGEC